MKQEDSEKKLESIKLKRGYVATNFAYIESVIASIITTHYFKKSNEEFMAEVLEDEYFNFGLLFKILEKIIKKESIEDFPLGRLRRLQQLRNIIVHSQIIARATTLKGMPKIININEIKFKHCGKELDIEPLFNEYDSLNEKVKEALVCLPGGSQRPFSF